jgi:Pheromone A receptor
MSSNNRDRSDQRDAQFLRMTIMTWLLFLGYTAFQSIFLYSMLKGSDIHDLSFSYGQNHNDYGEIFKYTLAEYDGKHGRFWQYLGWTSVLWNMSMVFFFALTKDTLNTWRRWLVRCGLGKVWPRLIAEEPTGNQNSTRPELYTRSRQPTCHAVDEASEDDEITPLRELVPLAEPRPPVERQPQGYQDPFLSMVKWYKYGRIPGLFKATCTSFGQKLREQVKEKV